MVEEGLEFGTANQNVAFSIFSPGARAIFRNERARLVTEEEGSTFGLEKRFF